MIAIALTWSQGTSLVIPMQFEDVDLCRNLLTPWQIFLERRIQATDSINISEQRAKFAECLSLTYS